MPQDKSQTQSLFPRQVCVMLARCAEAQPRPSTHSQASCSQRRRLIKQGRCWAAPGQTITTVYLAALTDRGASRGEL